MPDSFSEMPLLRQHYRWREIESPDTPWMMHKGYVRKRMMNILCWWHTNTGTSKAVSTSWSTSKRRIRSLKIFARNNDPASPAVFSATSQMRNIYRIELESSCGSTCSEKGIKKTKPSLSLENQWEERLNKNFADSRTRHLLEIPFDSCFFLCYFWQWSSCYESW